MVLRSKSSINRVMRETKEGNKYSTFVGAIAWWYNPRWLSILEI